MPNAAAKTKTAAAKPAKKAAAAKSGAKTAAAKLAAAPIPAGQLVATPDLQQLCDEQTEIVGRLSAAKGKVNEVTADLHKKNDEMLAAGAVPGMIFEVDGDPMQLTHNVRPSKSLAAVIAEFCELHPECAEEIAELEIKHTKENQQQPSFKAA